jgi:hypothetical protein
MSDFLLAAKELVYPNGVSITVSTVTNGAYNVETGSVSSTVVSTVIKAFPKRLKATAYSYPALIGKNVTEFLIVGTDLASPPSPLDKITRGTDVYTVDSTSEHVADGVVVLYKVIAVMG